MLFADRREAAFQLSERLGKLAGRKDGVVLAVPRGGVVVGSVLAESLRLPLDVVLVKKLGHPLSPEYAIGVVDLAGESIDEEVVERDGISRAYLDERILEIRSVLRERYRTYRGGRAPIPLKGKTVLIADDGLATGFTMAAAVRAVRRDQPARIVVAVPVSSREALSSVRAEADEVVCLHAPRDFRSIGSFYEDFSQVEDEEAIRLLKLPSFQS